MSGSQVKKSYQVVTVRAELSANEQNLLTLLVRELKQRATDYRESVKRNHTKSGQVAVLEDIPVPSESLPSTFDFHLPELAEVMGVTAGALSQTLNETTTKMMKRVVSWPTESGSFDKEQLLGPSKYHAGSGRLTLTLHPRTKSAILEETRGVSIVDLRLSLSLRGGYDKRILDIISTFKNHRDFECDFESFQEMVGAKVSNYSRGLESFRKTVLDVPLKRIFAASEGVWEPKDEKGKGYELIKEGRKVKRIIFKVRYNDPEALKVISDIHRNELAAEKEAKDPMQQPYEFTLPGMEDKVRTFTKMTDAVSMHLVAYEAMANLQGHKIPADIAGRIKMLRK